jgi:hypothetical protein
MQISASIVDWDCQEQLAVGVWNLDHSQGDSDSFTLHNDSVIFNCDFADLYVRARNRLPSKEVEVLDRFLVNLCPALFNLLALQPDYDLGRRLEWIYSAQAPKTVRTRLASLLEIDLRDSLSVFAEEISRAKVIEAPAELYTFIFMWAAAHGQAASKDWGLIVKGG